MVLIEGGRGDGKKYEAILAAAARVFARAGYDRSKIEDVAADAGVGKGTIYLYFSSKEQLLESVVRRSLDQYVAGMAEVTASDAPVRDIISRLAAYTLESARRNRAMARILLDSMSGIWPEFRNWLLAHRQQTIGQLAEVLRRGIRSGEIRPVDPEVAASILTGALSSLVITHLAPGSSDLASAEADEVADMLWCGIGESRGSRQD